jgi:hypothetical protein
MCQGTGPGDSGAEAAAAPRRRDRRVCDPTVVAGKEAVGRQVAVWNSKLGEWPKASIARFNPDSGEHLVRFLERGKGSVKHEEKWVNLARNRFQWLAPPTSDTASNPTNAGAPRGEEAVGYQVRVFWPGMARWYQGRVEAYNPDTKAHTVRYRDGDVQQLTLRHEAMNYLDKKPLPAAPPRVRPPSGGAAKAGAKRVRGGAAAAAAAAAADSSGEEERRGKSGRSSSTREDGAAVGPTTATPPKKRKGAPAARPRSASETSGEEEEEEGGGDGGSSDDGASAGGSDEEEGEEEEEGEGSEAYNNGGGDSDFDMGHARGRRGRPPGRGGRGAARRGVSSSKRGRRPGGAAPARPPASGDGIPRRRGRPPGSGAGRRGGARGRGRGGGLPPSMRDYLPPSLLYQQQRGALRVARADDEAIRVAGAAVVGARVATFWNDEESYYKVRTLLMIVGERCCGFALPWPSTAHSGFLRRPLTTTAQHGTPAQGKLVQFDSYHKRHKILYDDGEEEWVALPRESFRWLTPRAASAGCTPDFRQAMAVLGAHQEDRSGAPRRLPLGFPSLGTPAPAGEPAAEPPAPEAAPGWRVSVRCEAEGRWHRGEVLAHDAATGRHLVLYEDGEDEWLIAGQERVAWHAPVPQGRAGLFPGKAPGVEAPAGRDAVGWRVAVFWPGDAAFYPGEVSGFDEASGKHEVSYDDGEEGTVALAEDAVKWVLPPGMAVDHEALERLEAGGGRARRRVTAAGGDSDPDYEFEAAAAAAAAAYAAPRPGRRPGVGRGGRFVGGGGHSWEGMGGGDGYSDGLASPAMSLSLSMRHLAHHGGGPPAAEVFAGEPRIVRRLTRVPSFANLSGEGEARLPAAVTVRIYLSSSATSSGDAAAAAAAPAPPGQAGPGADRPAGEAAVGGAEAAPSAAAAAWVPVGEASRLQSRLSALDLMTRRVGRAQQAMVKGTPTALPMLVMRPPALGVAGRPGLTLRLPGAAQRAPGGPASALAGGGGGDSWRRPPPGSHRLARPSGLPHSPFRRALLEEEEDEEEDDDEEEEEEDDEGLGDEEDEDGDEGSDRAFGAAPPASSSGSSDGEEEGGSGEGDEAGANVVSSPRSPLFGGRGGKVKPLGEGAAEQASPAVMPPFAGGGHNPHTGSPMVLELPQHRPAAAKAPAVGTSLGMAALPAGDLPPAEMVASLLALPRHPSAVSLLGDMADAPGAFMDLE